MVRIIKKIENGFEFSNGQRLYSNHDSDCCESHYLDTSGIEESEYKDLEFDLTIDEPFKRIDGYGIELLATNNFPLRIPGYGFNNGYYSNQLILILEDNNGKIITSWDITDCQEEKGVY